MKAIFIDIDGCLNHMNEVCSDIARPACDKAGFFAKLFGNDTCVNAMGGDNDGTKH